MPAKWFGDLVNLSQSVSDRESVVTCQLQTQEDQFTKIQVSFIITPSSV